MNKGLIIAIVIAAVLGLGIGGYFLYKKTKTSNAKPTASASASSTPVSRHESATIGKAGGKLTTSLYGVQVTATIPADAVTTDTKFTLTLSQSAFQAKSGTASPIVIILGPKLTLAKSVTYEALYTASGKPSLYYLDFTNKKLVSMESTTATNKQLVFSSKYTGAFTWRYIQ